MKRDQRQIVKILKDITDNHGWKCGVHSDEWIIEINNGRKTAFIYGYKFPNNNAAVEHICDDKAGLYCILNEHGISAVPHIFYENPNNNSFVDLEGNWKEQNALLRKWGKVVVKPNQGTGGNGVNRAHDESELKETLNTLFQTTRACAISPYREVMHEYRIIVLSGDVKLIYEKIRPVVIGNGKDSLIVLLFNQFPSYKAVDVEDFVPYEGQRVEIGWKHNLGQGAVAKLVTDKTITRELANIARKATSVIGANFVSVDVIESDCGYEVLEINSGVMMESFSRMSQEHYNIAKSIYEDALNAFFIEDTEMISKKRFVLPLIEKIAEEDNIELVKDEEWGSFDIITNGESNFVIKDYPFNINYSGSAQLCKNKGACSYFLRKLGFLVPREKSFIRFGNMQKTVDQVSVWLRNPIEYLGFDYPMILKPNSLSQGTGVVRIDNYAEGLDALYSIQHIPDDLFTIQEYVAGHDCRIVVLNGEIIQAYERVPFSIVGDGNSNIEELLKERQKQFITNNRDKFVDISDTRILKRIDDAGYRVNTILQKGESIRLQDICNLSLGGTAIDIQNVLSQTIKNVAIEVAKKLNLNLCGVDIMISRLDSDDYSILEVNSAPGLDNYLYSREERDNYLKEVYRKILHSIHGRDDK